MSKRTWILCGTIVVLMLAALVAIVESLGDSEVAAIRRLEAVGGELTYPARFDEPISILGHLQYHVDHPFLLDLTNAAFTDTELALIPCLPTLEGLYLKNGNYHPRALSALSELKQIQWLQLGGNNVTDEYMLYIPTLVKDSSLNVDSSSITDRGLEAIVKCDWIKTLSLSGTRISDVGLPQLYNLPHLWELSLDDTDVTDAGIMQLKDHPTLLRVSLRRTRVTMQGFIDFIAVTPDIVGYWDPRAPTEK